MDQFVVPQFIDVEDKIFGPVTTRQFLILLVAGLILFIAFKLADTALFIFFLATLGSFSLILAFVKINGQAFHYFLLNLFQTLRRPSRRIWYKMDTKEELDQLRRKEAVVIIEKINTVPNLSYSRLRDLTLAVNTGGYYKPEE